MRDFHQLLVVIPCLNEARTLPALIAQLVGDAPGATIVVADGGSTDGSQAIVAQAATTHANVHLLDNPARLQSAGLNRAVAIHGASHDWLLRIDAHCSYPRHYPATLLDAADRTAADSVVVPMLTQGATCLQRAIAAAQNSRLGTGGSLHRHLGEGQFVDHGHHALFRLAAFVEAGGYDESFSHNEDAELDCRLARHGARIWLEPAAHITYFPRRSFTALFNQYRGYGRGRARTVRKHGLVLKRRQKLPLLVLPAVAAAFVGLALGIFWLPAVALALPALIWFGASIGFGLVLAFRGRDRCAALAGPAAALMHLAWSTGYWGFVLRGRGRHVSN